MSNRPRGIVRFYRAAVRVLPPDVRTHTDETVEALEAQLGEAQNGRERFGVSMRAFATLPVVILLEWLEYLGLRRAPGRTYRGRGGMGFYRNIRFAFRTLAKAPSFAVSSVLLMAVGIGAATTIFTLVDHVLLRPLPYPDSDELIFVERGSHSGPAFRQMEEMQTLDGVAGARVSEVTMVGDGEPRRLRESRVTMRFFETFGARAVLGRLLMPDDYAAADVVVLDGNAWRRIWGSDPRVVGRTIEVDGLPLTVVGVVDGSFSLPERMVGQRTDLWRPVDWTQPEFESHEFRILAVSARLVGESSLAAAQSEMDAVAGEMSDLNENYQERDGSPRLLPITSLAEVTVRGVRQGLGLLMGAVALLLLVACANVAHLFLARGFGRTREMAVRRVMGAGTRNLVSQLLAESVVVGVLGGVIGLMIAWVGVPIFLALNPDALPGQEAVGIDDRILFFAILASVLTSLAFGLAPALRSVGSELAVDLRSGGRSVSTGRGVLGLRNVLVTGEVAVSLVLVASAGLLLRSFLTVRAQDAGFNSAQVWTVPLTPTEADTPEAYSLLTSGILEEIRDIPGVQQVAFGLTLPLEMVGGGRCCWRSTARLDGEDLEDVTPMMHPVSQGYFSTLEIEFLAGGGWSDGDVGSDPVPVVMNESLARDLYGSVDKAAGQVFGVGPFASVIVRGVTANVLHYGLDNDHGPALYLPIQRVPFSIPLAHFAVKVDSRVTDAVPQALRAAVWTAAPRLPIPTVRTMQSWLGDATAERKFGSAVFGAFAIVALLLAAGGLYSTLLFVAGQRRKELGIRLALGAPRKSVEAKLLRSGLALAGIGVAVGLAGAWMSGRFLENQIWGVERGDPISLGAAAILLLVTAAVASWIPARRAGAVDPVQTLRAE